MSTLGPSHPEDATTFGPSVPSGQNGAITSDDKRLTGSDLIKGGETPVLLVSDDLGRLGLFRYPAPMPDVPISLEDPAGAGIEAAAASTDTTTDAKTDEAKNGPVEVGFNMEGRRELRWL